MPISIVTLSKKTEINYRSSAAADKPRDAFLERLMACLIL